MKPTVRDVALAASVSIGTVSRVLNGDANVSPEMASRVHDAVRTTNYRRLRQRSRFQRDDTDDRILAGKTIGLILLGMSEALSTLPVVVSAVQGVEAALSEAGAGLRLVNAPTAELPESARRDRFDGLILKGALQGDLAAAAGPVILDRLSEVPAVWVLGRPVGLSGDGVTANDWRAGQMAADYLLARGHRRLAFLNPKPDHAGFRIRAAGFADRAAGRATVRMYLGLPAGGRPFPLPPVQTVDAVAPLLDALLADSPPPTAVYVPADNIAALVYRAAAARGVAIGQDLSIVSCNHERSLIAGLYPALATVDTHPEQVGRVAVGWLARRVAGDAGPVVDIHVDPEMVPGESVADIR